VIVLRFIIKEETLCIVVALSFELMHTGFLVRGGAANLKFAASAAAVPFCSFS
jgi:hypothetical protein